MTSSRSRPAPISAAVTASASTSFLHSWICHDVLEISTGSDLCRGHGLRLHLLPPLLDLSRRPRDLDRLRSLPRSRPPPPPPRLSSGLSYLAYWTLSSLPSYLRPSRASIASSASFLL